MSRARSNHTLAITALGLGLGIAGAATGAPFRPAIGLSPAFAQLHIEQGEGHHAPGAEDRHGSAVAAGDFNGDGFDDLATGIPGNDCDFVVWDCGSVQIRFGWESAPLLGYLTLDPAHPGAPDAAEAFDRYGASLAVGDFDGDGYDDLAVGVPYELGPNLQGGAVQIHRGLHGSLGSIEWAASHLLRAATGLVPPPGVAARYTHLGWSMAVGDFDGDGFDDLAIGDPFFTSSGALHHGRVVIAHGHPDAGEGGGLVPFEGFTIDAGDFEVGGAREAENHFGYSLAAGDFNGDGFDDLAIGEPDADDAGTVDAGSAHVVYGSPFSLILTSNGGVPAPAWIFESALGGSVETGDRFGGVLAAGDFDGDGYDDLAIGVPAEDVGGAPGADQGAVWISYGGAIGLPSLDRIALWEDVILAPNESEPFDLFGASLAVGDFDRDGIDDLAIGAPGEELPGEFGTLPDHGAVTVVLGRFDAGLPGAVRQLAPREVQPPTGGAHAGMIPALRFGSPLFGASLAVGDFDRNGQSDLAIGATGFDVASTTDAGGVAVIYGLLFVDGFEEGDFGEWSSSIP